MGELRYLGQLGFYAVYYQELPVKGHCGNRERTVALMAFARASGNIVLFLRYALSWNTHCVTAFTWFSIDKVESSTAQHRGSWRYVSVWWLPPQYSHVYLLLCLLFMIIKSLSFNLFVIIQIIINAILHVLQLLHTLFLIFYGQMIVNLRVIRQTMSRYMVFHEHSS